MASKVANPNPVRHLTTFAVADVKPEPFNFQYRGPIPASTADLISALRAYKNAEAGQLIKGTDFAPAGPAPGQGSCLPSENGFVYAVTEAYNHHHHLVLRPDDLWLAIMTQFSFYINKEAEKYRSQFVNFEGKKELVVGVPGSLFSASYETLVNLMEDEIHKNLVDGDVRAWIMPSFSTTTPSDRVVAGVVFMAAMKKYFDYKFCLCCGIPTVTLDGTVADWTEIRKRVEKLDQYGLEEWTTLLRPILDQFVAAKEGRVDKDFWNRVCHNSGGGSGPSYLGGWITAFCYFDTEGNKPGKIVPGNEWPRVDTNDIPPGIVEVDVLVDDNGTEYKTVMLAGHMAQEVSQDKMSITPKSGWAICLKKSQD